VNLALVATEIPEEMTFGENDRVVKVKKRNAAALTPRALGVVSFVIAQRGWQQW
jgi:hypothetical protein